MELPAGPAPTTITSASRVPPAALVNSFTSVSVRVSWGRRNAGRTRGAGDLRACLRSWRFPARRSVGCTVRRRRSSARVWLCDDDNAAGCPAEGRAASAGFRRHALRLGGAVEGHDAPGEVAVLDVRPARLAQEAGQAGLV